MVKIKLGDWPRGRRPLFQKDKNQFRRPELEEGLFPSIFLGAQDLRNQ